ncbi:MAG: flippase-like domain-containing protein [Bacteroidales bacterium]|nr:flippase-like domain-containing protein [Bacteroidales bacterium]
MSTENNTFVTILKKIIKFILFFGVGVLFIYLSIKDLQPEDWKNLKESALQAAQGYSWLWLLCAFAAGVLSHYVRALRTKQLLQPLGYNVRRSMSFVSVMVCYICNLAFPRLGEVLRCTCLQTFERVPFQKTLGTVLTERAIDLIILIVTVCAAILINTGILSQLVVDQTTGLTLGEKLTSVFSGLIFNYKLYVILALIILFFVLARLTREKWSKIGLFVKIKNFFVGIWQGLVSVKDLKSPALFVFYTLAIWVLYFSECLFCCQAFEFLSGINMAAIFTVFAMGNIGFLIGPGGLGAYWWIVAGTLVFYGVDYSSGLAAGMVGWGVQTFMVLLVGSISLIAASLMKAKTKSDVNENVGKNIE